MKQHKIIMCPIGYSIPISDNVIPQGAVMIAYTTEAVLIGTIDRDGLLYKGLLAQDNTFFIEEAAHQLLENEQLLAALSAGKVHKRLSTGTIEYDVKAKLIIVCQPFVPSNEVKELFEILEYPSIVNTQ